MEQTQNDNLEDQELNTLEDTSSLDAVKSEEDKVPEKEMDSKAGEETESDPELEALVAEFDAILAGTDTKAATDGGTSSSDADYFKNYSKMVVDNAYSTAFDGPKQYWEQGKEEYEEKYGDEAEEKFKEDYEVASQEHYRKAKEKAEEEELKAEINGDYLDFFGTNTNKASKITASVVLETKTGARSVAGMWTSKLQSTRKKDVESNRVQMPDGTWVDIPEGEDFNSLTDNMNYTDKDGKTITGYNYVPSGDYDRTPGYLKAIVQGGFSEGEIVNIWDMNDNMLSSNNLESSAALGIAKSIPRTVIGLASDLFVSTAELMNGAGVIMNKYGGDGEGHNAFIDSTRDFATYLNKYKISKTDYDTKNIITAANAADMIGNIIGQYYMGGAVTGTVGKLIGASDKAIKAGAITGKALERAQKIKNGVFLSSMSLMAGSGMKDEARRAGFSEEATAWMYMAYVPAMFMAQKMSSLSEGNIAKFAQRANLKQGLASKNMFDDVSKVALESLEKTKGKTNGSLKSFKSIWEWAKGHADKAANKMHANVIKEGASAYGAAAAMEGQEEVMEQLFEDGLKNAVSAISHFTASDPTKAPKFKTVFDDGYFGPEFFTNYAMSFVGGAIGGGMYKGIAQLKGQGLQGDSEIVRGDADDMTQQLAYLKDDHPAKVALFKMMKSEREKDNGVFGSTIYSSKPPENGRRFKMSELTDEDKQRYPSIAEANYFNFMSNYNRYSTTFGGSSGRLEDFKKAVPAVAALLGDETASFEAAKKVANNRDALYVNFGAEQQSMDPTLKSAILAENDVEEEAEAPKPEAEKEDTDAAAEVPKQPTITLEEAKDQADMAKLNPDIVKNTASTLKISESQAREIILAERKVDDILSGRAAEKELIQAISKMPQYAILSGGSKDSAISKYGEDFLDILMDADNTRHKDNIERFENEKQQRIDNTALVQGMTSLDDIQKLLDANEGESIRLAPTAKQEFIAKYIESFNEAFETANVPDAEGNIYDLRYAVAEDLGLDLDAENDPIAQMWITDSEVEDGGKSIDDFGEDYEAAKTSEEKGDVLNKFLDAHVFELYEGAWHNVLSDESLTPYALSKMKKDPNMLNRFAQELIKDPSKFAASTDLGEDANIALDVARGTVPKNTSAIVSDNEVIKSLQEYADGYNMVLNKASEHLSTEAGDNDISYLGNTFSTGANGKIDTDDESIFDLASALYNNNVQQVGDKRVFSGLADAKRLKTQLEVRRAQTDLLGFMHPFIAQLREYNATTLSGAEFGTSLSDATYDKYSKNFAQMMYDPAIYDRLEDKKNKGISLSKSEKEQFEAMDIKVKKITETRVDNANALLNAADKKSLDEAKADSSILEQLSAAERIIEELITIGEESADEAKLAKMYTASAKDKVLNLMHKASKLKAHLDAHIANTSDDTKALYEVEEWTTFNMTLNDTYNHIDLEGASDEEIIAAYKSMDEVFKAMYALPQIFKEALLNTNIVGDTAFSEFSEVAINAFINVVDFNADFKSVMEQQLGRNKDDAPILPIADQVAVAKMAYAFLTDENQYGSRMSSRFMRTDAGKVSMSADEPDMSNIIGIDGGLGTGKTKIALGYALAAARRHSKGIRPKFDAQVLLASNNTRQLDTMYETVAKEFSDEDDNVVFGRYTQQQLYELLTSDADLDTLHATLKNVAYIAYDEATFIEAGNGSDVNALETMLNTIHRLNMDKRIDDGLPPLRLMALGDGKQGGFYSNMPKVTEDDIPIDYNNLGEKKTLNTMTLSYLKTPRLTYQFRSRVNEVNQSVKDALRVASVGDFSMLNTGQSTNIEELRTSHGVIANDDKQRWGGTHIVDSSLNTKDVEDSIYDDPKLVAELEKQVKADKDFKIILVTEIKDLPDGSPLTEFVKANPDNVTIQNIKEVQGDECDYILMDLPDGFLPPLSEVTPENSGKYEIYAMLLGRARFYARANVGANVNFQKSTRDIIMVTKQSTDALRNDWKTFLFDGIFGTTTASAPVIEPTVTTTEPKPEKVIDNESKVATKLNVFLGASGMKGKEITDIMDDLQSTVEASNIDEDPLLPEDIDEWTRADIEHASEALRDTVLDEKDRSYEELTNSIEQTAGKLDVIMSIMDGTFDDSANDSIEATQKDDDIIGALIGSGESAAVKATAYGYTANDNTAPVASEEAGAGVGYRSEGRGGPAKQRRNTVFYMRDIFGGPINEADFESIHKINLSASGGMKKGSILKNARAKFSLVAHEYNQGGDLNETKMMHGFRLVAELGGRHYTIMTLPGIGGNTVYKDNSPIKDLLQSVDERLVSAVETYLSNDFSVTEAAFGKNADNKGYTVHEQSIKNNNYGSEYLNKKLGTKRNGDNKTALYVSIPIPVKAMESIILGHTPGSIRTGSEETQSIAKKETMVDDINLTTSVQRTAIENVDNIKTRTNNNAISLADMEGTNYFQKFGGKKARLINIPGRAPVAVFVVKVGHRSIPFMIDNSSGFNAQPIFGFHEDGLPIVWEGTKEDGLPLDLSIEYMKNYLSNSKHMNLDFSTLGKAIESNDPKLQQSLANKLNYDLDELKDKSKNPVEVATKDTIMRAPRSWDSTKISVFDFERMLEINGRNMDGLHFSKPQSFKNSNKHKGRAFMFYSFNDKHDLDNYEEMSKIVSKDVVDKAMASPEDMKQAIVDDLREGVGIIMLDSAPTSLVDLFRIAKNGTKKEIDKLNRFVTPAGGASGSRFMSLLVELTEVLLDKDNVTLSSHFRLDKDADFTRLEALKDALGENETKTILDPERKVELVKMLNSEYKNGNTEHLIHLVSMITTAVADKNLGHFIHELSDGTHVQDIPGKKIDGASIVRNAEGNIFAGHHPAAPITFIPSSLFQAIDPKKEYEGKLYMNFAGFLTNLATGSIDPGMNIENIGNRVKDDVAEGALQILQKIMSTYTNPGTLRNGLTMTPAFSGSVGEGIKWAPIQDTKDGEGMGVKHRLFTNIKDIHTPSVIFDIEALATAVGNSVKNGKQQKPGTSTAPAKVIKESTIEAEKRTEATIQSDIAKVTSSRDKVLSNLIELKLAAKQTNINDYHSAISSHEATVQSFKTIMDADANAHPRVTAARQDAIDAIKKSIAEAYSLAPKVSNFGTMRAIAHKIPNATILGISDAERKQLVALAKPLEFALTVEDVKAIADNIAKAFPKNKGIRTYVVTPIASIKPGIINDIDRINYVIDNVDKALIDLEPGELDLFTDGFANFDAEYVSKRAALATLRDNDMVDKPLLLSFLRSGTSDVSNTLWDKAQIMKQFLANTPEGATKKDFADFKKDNPKLFEKIMKTQDVKDNISIIAEKIDGDDAFDLVSDIINSISEPGNDLHAAQKMVLNTKSNMSAAQKQILQEMIDSKKKPDMHPVEEALSKLPGVTLDQNEINAVIAELDRLEAHENVEMASGGIEAISKLLAGKDFLTDDLAKMKLAGGDAKIRKLLRKIKVMTDANNKNIKCN